MDDKNNYKNLHVMKVFFEYFKNYKMKIFILFLVVLIAGFIEIINPFLIGLVIDGLVEHSHEIVFTYIPLIILSSSSLIFINSFVAIFSTNLVNNIEFHVKSRLLKNIFDMNFTENQKFSTGMFIERVENDVSGMPHFVIEQVIDTILNVITVLVILVILFRIDIYMTLITLAAYPIIFILNLYYGKRVQKVTEEFKTTKDIYLENLKDTFLGYRTIKIYGMQFIFKKIIFNLLGILCSQKLKIVKLLTTNSMLFKIISLIFYFIVFLTGVQNVLNGTITVGELVTFNVYIHLLTESLLELTQLPRIVDQNIVSIKRILELKEKTENSKPKKNNQITDLKKISLEKISYAYNRESPVLKNVNACFKKGKMNYIIGNVGSGKSTILKLISGLVEPQKGEIHFDNNEIREYDLSQLLNSVIYVTQDDFFFKTSIKENLIGDSPSSTKISEMIKFSEKLGIHDYIESLPEGYNTIIGSNNLEMSKGQKHLLVLCRALIWKKEVILIDEITASLDEKHEKNVITVLEEICFDIIVIIVSHNLIKQDEKNNIYTVTV